ncbi:MAG: hypothetical protein K0U93_11770 [Gammaproteobacteria bacterium]|nr:hypothetical protein [Gammaproteobacteria bacterium]
MTEHADAWAAHDAAVESGLPTYVDPHTGWQVFTSATLRQRGTCCGNGCRHCPFAHERVPLERRAAAAQQATWLTQATPDPQTPTAVLMWSGGIDGYLAYLRWQSSGALAPLALLSTFDVGSDVLQPQNILLSSILEQANALGLPLLGVPLHPGRDYNIHVEAALRLVENLCTVICADHRHAYMRGWREETLSAVTAPRGADVRFPLWGMEDDELFDLLPTGIPQITVSAVGEASEDAIVVGSLYDRQFVSQLPRGTDPFGENGEFHTFVDL